MLAKKRRLRAADFKEFRGAAVLHTPHFLLRVKKTAGSAPARAAAVVSAAVSKKAVTRNLIRRRVYAVLEGNDFRALPPLLLSISAKKGAKELSFSEIKQELAAALLKIRAMR